MKIRNGGGEKIPIVPGKKQRLHFAGAAVKRYPMSKVRGSSQECQAVTAQEWPRRATLRPRPGAVAGRSNPMPEARAAAGRTNPTSKELWLRGCRRA